MVFILPNGDVCEDEEIYGLPVESDDDSADDCDDDCDDYYPGCTVIQMWEDLMHRI